MTEPIRSTVFRFVLVVSVFALALTGLAAENRKFETFLGQLRKTDPAKYERIMREWDREQAVEGPMWGSDGRELYAVPMTNMPVGLLVDVYTGRLAPGWEDARRQERVRTRGLGRFCVVSGFLSIALGLVSLWAPKFLWQWRQFTAELKGLQTKRTATWDASRRFGGWSMLIVGASLVVVGLLLAFV